MGGKDRGNLVVGGKDWSGPDFSLCSGDILDFVLKISSMNALKNTFRVCMLKTVFL
jgi:hypothetical protein